MKFRAYTFKHSYPLISLGFHFWHGFRIVLVLIYWTYTIEVDR
jgi:hypothetical protein